MILIAAFTYREANAIARNRGLSPREWRLLSARELHGRRGPKVLQASCWYDAGELHVWTDEEGTRHAKRGYPVSEGLRYSGAEIEMVGCA